MGVPKNNFFSILNGESSITLSVGAKGNNDSNFNVKLLAPESIELETDPATIIFDFNKQQITSWTPQTTQDARATLTNLPSTFELIEIKGKKLVFKIPDDLANCDKLLEENWVTKSNDNVQIWRSKLIGDVIPDDTLEFTDCKTCVKCIPTEAPVAPPTVPVTTTTMPTTTTKNPCSKPLDGAKIINSL